MNSLLSAAVQRFFEGGTQCASGTGSELTPTEEKMKQVELTSAADRVAHSTGSTAARVVRTASKPKLHMAVTIM